MATGAKGRADGEQRFAFVFPMASGHINPSFPVARSLVAVGHEVHYLCREQMREAIEDTGSVFHSEIEHKPELYEGREADLMGAFESLRREYELEDDSIFVAANKVRLIGIELMMPGILRWLKELRPSAVVYCPMMTREAAFASKVLDIPSVALLTLAGPGSVTKAFDEIYRKSAVTPEEVESAASNFAPNLDAVSRMRTTYGLHIDSFAMFKPFGRLEALEYSKVTLVTTSEDLQDPMTPELEHAYEKAGVAFVTVGPLLDTAGAKRAAGHKYDHAGAAAREASGAKAAPGGPATPAASDAELLRSVRAAHEAGRFVVLVSMGTVITGDSPDFGWEGRLKDADGVARGLSGRELCRAAWSGVFDAFGTARPGDGPLLVVALGPQPGALGDVDAPPNALCAPTFPQVDILKAGVDLFLTHGGQNSFTEALASGVPVVVCPGFGDQPINARKAVALGVGLQVERPEPEEGGEAAAAAQYSIDVSLAVREVLAEASFGTAAARCAKRLELAGGVPRAVEQVLLAANAAAGAANHGGA